MMYLSLNDLKNLHPLNEQSHLLMFLKKKGMAKLIVEGVYMSKEENSALTVSIEAVLLSCVIDTREKKDM